MPQQSPTQSQFSTFASGPSHHQEPLGGPHGFQGTPWKIDNYTQVLTLFFFPFPILRRALAGANFYIVTPH